MRVKVCQGGADDTYCTGADDHSGEARFSEWGPRSTIEVISNPTDAAFLTDLTAVAKRDEDGRNWDAETTEATANPGGAVKLQARIKGSPAPRFVDCDTFSTRPGL